MSRSQIDVLVSTAGQLVTCAGLPGPRRGLAMREVGIVPGGAVAIRNGLIIAVGGAGALRERYAPEQEIDAGTRTICPGFVDTPLTASFDGAARADFLAAYQPLPGVIQANEVAALAVYLASDAAKMITGQSFVIDGGQQAGLNV